MLCKVMAMQTQLLPRITGKFSAPQRYGYASPTLPPGLLENSQLPSTVGSEVSHQPSCTLALTLFNILQTPRSKIRLSNPKNHNNQARAAAQHQLLKTPRILQTPQFSPAPLEADCQDCLLDPDRCSELAAVPLDSDQCSELAAVPLDSFAAVDAQLAVSISKL